MCTIERITQLNISQNYFVLCTQNNGASWLHKLCRDRLTSTSLMTSFACCRCSSSMTASRGRSGAGCGCTTTVSTSPWSGRWCGRRVPTARRRHWRRVGDRQASTRTPTSRRWWVSTVGFCQHGLGAGGFAVSIEIKCSEIIVQKKSILRVPYTFL